MKVEDEQLKGFFGKHSEQLEKQWEELVERTTNSVIIKIYDTK